MWNDIALGLDVAVSLQGVWYCLVGVLLGTIIGALPGVGIMSAVAMLLPLTFYLPPAIGLIMLAGIYYGAAYGGSIASIMLNLPGTANTAVTCLDGYPMMQQGRGAIALFITAIASFVGSISGTVVLVCFSLPLAALALRFGPWEYFAVMVLGLIAASTMASTGLLRAVSMVLLGLLLGIAGPDINSGISRYTFEMPALYDGVPLVALALGLFGLPELISNVTNLERATVSAGGISVRSMVPTRDDWRRSIPAMARGSGVGMFFGMLPGTGGTVASFVSYSIEKQINAEPARFGKGAIEGVSGPEAANNSAVQAAFIPTLSLGIPGDAVMALMIGALIMHGIVPGPQLVSQHPDIFWGLIFSFVIGNIILLVLNIPFITLWVRLLSLPYWILFPSIVAFLCIGVYSINLAAFDILILGLFGAVGLAMRYLDFDAAPLLLGFILGPMMEENLRRAMLMSGGDPSDFLLRPVSAGFLIASALLVAWRIWQAIRDRRMP